MNNSVKVHNNHNNNGDDMTGVAITMIIFGTAGCSCVVFTVLFVALVEHVCDFVNELIKAAM